MGMELLTSTDTDRLHERASALLVNMEALRDELLLQDGAVRSLYPGWEGQAADAMYPLWTDWFRAMRETSYTATHAGYTMSRLANELAIAQLEYRRVIDDAEAAGYRVRDDGMLEQPPAGATEDPAETARRVDEFRLFIHRIEGALEEAEAADQRAADNFAKDLEGQTFENGALAAFLKTALGAEGYVSALAGTPGKTADILDDLARTGGGAEAARGAKTYRGVANNRILGMLAKTWKGLPVTSWAAVPFSYAQSRAEGKDGGEATTDAVVSAGMGLASGAAVAWGTSAIAGAATAAGLAFPPAGVAILLTLGAVGATWLTLEYGPTVSRAVHERVVTPLAADFQELGDNVRDDFWDTIDSLGYHARNFPRDFREAIMG